MAISTKTPRTSRRLTPNTVRLMFTGTARKRLPTCIVSTTACPRVRRLPTTRVPTVVARGRGDQARRHRKSSNSETFSKHGVTSERGTRRMRTFALNLRAFSISFAAALANKFAVARNRRSVRRARCRKPPRLQRTTEPFRRRLREGSS